MEHLQVIIIPLIGRELVSGHGGKCIYDVRADEWIDIFREKLCITRSVL